MTITLTVAGRIATVEADGHAVAGNTYPVTLALDSEWTGDLYLRVRFGSLYYDIPFASSAASVDVQMPVGYPEVGIGVYSEALEICTSEARVRLLRSILEAGEQVVEFDSDLYDQWAGEVTTLLTDDAFDAESTRPVQNAVLTAWKDTVPLDSALVHKTGAETVGGSKTFTSDPAITALNYPVLKMDSQQDASATGIKGEIRMMDRKNGSQSAVSLVQAITNTGYNIGRMSVYNPDKSQAHNIEVRSYSDHQLVTVDAPYYPVDGSSNPQALTANALVTSGNIAVDPRLVHTTGNEAIAGTKTFGAPPVITSGSNALTVNNPSSYSASGARDVIAFNGAGSEEARIYRYSNGTTNGLYMRQVTPGASTYSQFGLVARDNGQGFAECPSYTTDNSADDKIVTRSMLAQTPTVVHTTGAEAIAGTKTFSGMLATTKDFGWCRTYTHTVAPGSWVKVYEVKRVASSGGLADIFNDFALDTWRGIEMYWGIGAGSGGYRMSGAIYGNVTSAVGRLAGVMARRASDNIAEIWIGNAQASGNVNLIIDCKHVRTEPPIPSEATGDKPVVGDVYSEVVDMNVY